MKYLLILFVMLLSGCVQNPSKSLHLSKSRIRILDLGCSSHVCLTIFGGVDGKRCITSSRGGLHCYDVEKVDDN